MKVPKDITPVDTPDDFMIKCKKCSSSLIHSQVRDNYYVCNKCGELLPRTSECIINEICDSNSFLEMFGNNEVVNPISFKDYEKKIINVKKQTKLDEAVVTGLCKIGGRLSLLGVMDNRFIMGSMGSVVGTKIAKMFEYATIHKLPVVIFTTSGGARMQEGIISLMQMAHVSMAIKKHSNHGLFYMPILMNPTTGGVTASFAQLGDIIISEPESLICFAGPRVIKKTINQELPEGFQKAEFLLEHGFLDAIVKRSDQRDFIIKCIYFFGGQNG